MASLSLTTSSAKQRPYDSARTGRTESGLARAIESLNAHLASSLAASGEIKDHSRPGD